MDEIDDGDWAAVVAKVLRLSRIPAALAERSSAIENPADLSGDTAVAA